MGLQFKHYECVSHRPNTEPEAHTQGTGPRGAVLREVRRDQHTYTVSGAEEGAPALRQGPPGERTRYVHKVRQEHRTHWRRTPAGFGAPPIANCLLPLAIALDLHVQSTGDLSHLPGGGSVRALGHHVSTTQVEPDLLAVRMSRPERQPLVLAPAHL